MLTTMLSKVGIPATLRIPVDMSVRRVNGRRLGIRVSAWIVLGMVFAYVVVRGWGSDAHAYWNAWSGGLYDADWHAPIANADAFVYSPALAQTLWPFQYLPWPAFFVIWTATNLGALIAMAGPALAAILVVVTFEPFRHELMVGNIDLLVALGIVAAMRWSGVWAIPLLVKVTPGVGVLWFAFRAEWRRFLIALGVTTVIVAASAAIAPHLWVEWGQLLLASPDKPPRLNVLVLVPLPLVPRIAVAVALVAVGARTDRPWLVPVACFVAAPLPTIMRASMLVAVLPLLGWGPLATSACRRRRCHPRGSS